MEIDFKEYLSDGEIKDIIVEEFRIQIRKKFSSEKETERLLGNLAFHIVKEELEKITPNYEEYLNKKVNKILKEEASLKYLIFDTHYSTGEPKSFASKLVESTVKQNTELIKEKVIESLTGADYSTQIAVVLERSVENLASNIYEIAELLNNKK